VGQLLSDHRQGWMGIRQHEQKAGSPSYFIKARVLLPLEIIVHLYSKYQYMCPVNTKEIFCVQVRNKPSMKYIVVIHLIPWIHSRGSETKLKTLKLFFIESVSSLFF
jgi:hypothetical protein